MKELLAKPAKPVGLLMAAVAVMVVVVRVAEGVLAGAGVLDYSYKLAASPNALDGSLFDKVMVVSSAATFFGFLVTAAVVVAIAVAFAFTCARALLGVAGRAPQRIVAEAVWAVVAVVVSLVCMLAVVTGLFSGTQLSLAGGAAGGTSMGAVPVGLLLALVTLLVLGAEAVRFSGLGSGEARPVRLLVAALACSAAVAACTGGAFAGLDSQPLDAGLASAWLLGGAVLNLVLAFAFALLDARAVPKAQVTRPAAPAGRRG